jgi:cytochrome d ubiquinol oxidase subunit II
LSVVSAFAGAVAIISGIRRRLELRAFLGSCLLISGLLCGAAAALFPELLHSTVGAEFSLTAYNSSVNQDSLAVAMIWWPIGLVLALLYAGFISRSYRGKIGSSEEVSKY